MISVADTFAVALQQHQTGNLQQAALLYDQVLRLDPDHADALNLLGLAHYQQQRGDLAIDCLRRAAELRPDLPQVRCNLALALKSANRLDEAIACYREALQQAPHYTEGWYNLGIALSSRKEHAEAAECFTRALAQKPEWTDARICRGNALQSLGEYEAAQAEFCAVLAVRPDDFAANYNLGNCLTEMKHYEAALQQYELASELDPENAAPHFSRGNALQLLERREEAVAAYRRALELAPRFADAHRNLGGALYALGRYEDSVASFRRSLELSPADAESHSNLGRALHRLGKLDEAVASVRRALARRPEYADAWVNLGTIYAYERLISQALECFREVVRIEPDHRWAWHSLSVLLKVDQQIEEAERAYRRANAARIDSPLARLWLATLCPIVMRDNRQIDEYRDQLLTRLQSLADEGLMFPADEIATYGSVPPPGLQFHGRDDRPLKEAFASVFRHSFPQEPPPPRTGKPRLGFTVSAGHEGIFLRYLGGVLERLPTDDFDLVIVCPATSAANIRKKINTDRIEIIPTSYRFDEMQEPLRAARLDVLYHWEVGTDETNYYLPMCRLAPVQCTSGGNSGTTGLHAIDYFLSSELAEPPDAERFYTEKLLRTRGMPSWQTRLTLPVAPKPREEFGFSPQQHLYLCLQKIEKIHPDFDQVLAEILRRDPRGLVALSEGRSSVAAELLRARLRETIPDVVERIMFMPRLGLRDYLSLLSAGDVHLDPLHYGSGMTMYDSISVNKPVVTLPGSLVRTRWTLGFYKRMGVDACIAGSVDEYIQRAVQLGTDAEFRRSVESQIAERSDLIFEDDSIVHEYERIFLRLILQARTR